MAKERRQGLVWLALLAGVAVAIGVVLAKGGFGSRSAQDADAILERVPRPERVILEARARNPQDSWKLIQRGVGGAVGILPQTIGGLLSTLAGGPPELASDVAGREPAMLVVARRGEAFDWVIATRAQDANRLLGKLTDGEVAPYKKVQRDGYVLLEPAEVRGAHDTPFGITQSGHVVVGSSKAALDALGPYAPQVLSDAPLPHDLVARVAPAAIGEVLVPEIGRAWKAFFDEKRAQAKDTRDAHGGRPADYADPEAILGMLDAEVRDAMGLLGGVASCELEADITPDATKAEMLLAARDDARATKAWISALPTTSVERVPALRPNAELVVLAASADVPHSREMDARRWITRAKKAVGQRVAGSSMEKLEDAAGRWAKARGAHWTLVGEREPTGMVFTFETPAGDAAALDRAALDALEGARDPGIREPLERLTGWRWGAIQRPGADAPGWLSFTRADTDAAKKLGLSFGAHGETWRVRLVRAATSAEPDRANRPAKAEPIVRELGPKVSWLVVARAPDAGGDLTRGGLSVGRETGKLAVRVVLPHRAAHGWVRALGGF